MRWPGLQRRVRPLASVSSRILLARSVITMLVIGRRPLSVHTRSPAASVAMGRSPVSVRIRVSAGVHQQNVLLPPARNRSTSSGDCAPKTLASTPLDQRTIVPPVPLSTRIPGSHLRSPLGPRTQLVTASPRVGPTILIQCPPGTPLIMGGPCTSSCTYLAPAAVFPVPRPPASTHANHLPAGGIWCGSGSQSSSGGSRMSATADQTSVTSWRSVSVTLRGCRRPSSEGSQPSPRW